MLATLIFICFSFIHFSAANTADAAAGINHEINFQGKLVNPDGTNVTDGSYSIVFSIYSVATGGTDIWTETQTVTLSNGIFQVNLGSVTPLPGSINFNTDSLYLGVKVGTDAEMTPRIQFTSVPQAFDSEELNGLTSSAFSQLAANQTYTGTNTFQPTTNIQGVVIKQNSSGSFGQDVFDVSGSSSGNFIQVTSTAANQGAVTIQSLGSDLLTLQSGSGTVSLGSSTTLSATGALTVASGGSSALTLSSASGTIQAGSNNLTTTGGLTAGTGTFNAASGTGLSVTANALIGGSLTVSGVTALNVSSTTALSVASGATNSSALVNLDTTGDASNLINNGSFETNTTGWALKGGAAQISSPTQHLYGSESDKVTTSAAIGDGIKFPVTLTATQEYTLAVSVYATSSSIPTGDFDIGYANDGSTETNYAQTNGSAVSTGGWTRYSFTFTPSSISGTPYVFIKQLDATGRTFYIDGVDLETTTTTNQPQYKEGNIQVYGTINSNLSVQPISNATNAFTVENNLGQDILAVDTQNSQVLVGTASGAGKFTAVASNQTVGKFIQNGSSDILDLANSGGNVATFDDNGDLLPATNNSIDVGAVGTAFKDVYSANFDTGTTTKALTIAPTNATSVAIGNSGATLALTSSDFNVASTGSVTLLGGLSKDITTATAGTANGITLQPGISSAINGTGATTTIKGGDQSGTTCSSSNCTGGSLILQGGSATGSGTTLNGGSVTVDAGTGSTANGAVNLGTSNASTVTEGNNSALVFINGGSLSIGNNAVNKTINIGVTGSTANTTAVNIATSTGAAQTVTIGSTNTSGSVTLQSGNTQETLNGTSTVFQGITSAYDSATLGSEMNTGSESFGASTGWTVAGTGTSATAIHAAGNSATVALSPALTITSGSYYQVTYSATVSAGTLGVSIGGAAGTTVSYGGNFISVLKATGTFNLIFTPSSTYVGEISNVSVMQITIATPTLSVATSNGTAALEVRTGGPAENNTFIGLQAGQGTVGTANNNTALGYQALLNNTTGNGNTATGSQALLDNASGGSNTAEGDLSLAANQTGGNNTAVGYSSLGGNTVGSNNTAVGYSALVALRSGIADTALGYEAGLQDTAATFKTGATISYSTAIGAYAQVQASNSIVLGSVDNPTKVGIGTTIPLNTLSVSPVDYSTGTACSTASSGGSSCSGTSTTFLFGTTTTWTASMVGEQLIFADGQTATVNAVTSTTAITLSAAVNEASGTTYRIQHTGFQVTSAGVAFVQQSSTTALQAENNAGTSALTVDTTNMRVTAGTTLGTATGQLYVAGQVPTAATGSVGTSTNLSGVYVQGHYAYVTNSGGQLLQIIDVSNPATPVITGSLATGGGSGPQGIYVQGHYAYFVDNTSGKLQIVDVSNPAAPVSVSLVAAGAVPTSVYVQGRYAYVTNSTGGTLQIFDVSNPAAPVSVSTVTAGTAPTSVYVQGRYAYVANETSGTLQVFDVSNPASPASVGSVTATGADSVYVQGRYAYVGETNSLQVFDVSNPASPASAGSISTGTALPTSVYVQGRYAYVTGGSAANLKIIDVSSPASPAIVGTVTTGAGSASVYVQGRYAYVANGGGASLQVFDMGGEYTQQLQVGGTETGTLTVDTDATIAGDATIQGGLQVGQSLLAGAGSFTTSGAFSNSSLQASATNSNATSTVITSNGLTVSLTGGANTTASANVLNGVNLANVTAVTNNVFNGINFGTGYTNLINSATLKITAAGDETVDLASGGGGNAVCFTGGTNNVTGLKTLVDCSTTPSADYAENYPVASDVGYGDIVATGTQMVNTYDADANGNVDWTKVKGQITQLVKTTSTYQANTIGIVSDNYGDFTSTGYNIEPSDNPMPVALNGRVPVNIAPDSPAIEPGDYITTSATYPGMGTKATGSGYTIGKALGSWDPSSGDPTVMVFVEPGFYPGPQMASYVQNGGNATLSSLIVGGTADFADLNASGMASVQDLTVAGSATVSGDLTVAGLTSVADLSISGHIITGGSSPTVAINALAGQNASVSITGNDTSGTITITGGDPAQPATGGTPAVPGPASGDQASITFARPYTGMPHIIITANDGKSAAMQVYPDQQSPTGFSVALNQTPAPDTTYTFEYFIVQ